MFNPFQSPGTVIAFAALITFAYIGFLNVIDVVVWPSIERLIARRRRRRAVMHLRLQVEEQGRACIHRLIESQERLQ